MSIENRRELGNATLSRAAQGCTVSLYPDFGWRDLASKRQASTHAEAPHMCLVNTEGRRGAVTCTLRAGPMMSLMLPTAVVTPFPRYLLDRGWVRFRVRGWD